MSIRFTRCRLQRFLHRRQFWSNPNLKCAPVLQFGHFLKLKRSLGPQILTINYYLCYKRVISGFSGVFFWTKNSFNLCVLNTPYGHSSIFSLPWEERNRSVYRSSPYLLKQTNHDSPIPKMALTSVFLTDSFNFFVFRDGTYT